MLEKIFKPTGQTLFDSLEQKKNLLPPGKIESNFQDDCDAIRCSCNQLETLSTEAIANSVGSSVTTLANLNFRRGFIMTTMMRMIRVKYERNSAEVRSIYVAQETISIMYLFTARIVLINRRKHHLLKKVK